MVVIMKWQLWVLHSLYIHCLPVGTLAEEMDQQGGFFGSPECVHDLTLESVHDLN